MDGAGEGDCAAVDSPNDTAAAIATATRVTCMRASWRANSIETPGGSWRLSREGILGVARPVLPRSEVDARRDTGGARGELHQAGAHADRAIGDRFLSGLPARFLDQGLDLRRRLELQRQTIGEEILPEDER